MDPALLHLLSAAAGTLLGAAVSLAGPLGRAWLGALLAGKARPDRIRAMLETLYARLEHEDKP